MLRAKVQLQGADALLKRIQPAYTLMQRPLERVVESGSALMQSKAQGRMRSQAGSIAAAIRVLPDSQPLTRTVAIVGATRTLVAAGALDAGHRIVTSRAEAQEAGLSFRRFSYGRKRADGGPRRRYKNKAFNAGEVQFHWRGSKKRTKGWFTGTVRVSSLKKQMEFLMNRAASEIEAAWSQR